MTTPKTDVAELRGLRQALINLAFTPDQQESANAIRFYEVLDYYLSNQAKELIDRVNAHKDNPMLTPAKRRDANNMIDYIVSDLRHKLSELKGQVNEYE